MAFLCWTYRLPSPYLVKKVLASNNTTEWNIIFSFSETRQKDDASKSNRQLSELQRRFRESVVNCEHWQTTRFSTQCWHYNAWCLKNNRYFKLLLAFEISVRAVPILERIDNIPIRKTAWHITVYVNGGHKGRYFRCTRSWNSQCY